MLDNAKFDNALLYIFFYSILHHGYYYDDIWADEQPPKSQFLRLGRPILIYWFLDDRATRSERTRTLAKTCLHNRTLDQNWYQVGLEDCSDPHESLARDWRECVMANIQV